MALPAGNVNVSVHPLMSPPAVNYPIGNMGERFREEYKTDDGDELIQGVHIANKKHALFDHELMQGDWFFGKHRRTDHILTKGETAVATMDARSVMAWNDFWTDPANMFDTEGQAWLEGLKIRFIGVLKAAKGTKEFPADSYHSFTVGRRAFNAINYWLNQNDPVATGDHLWFCLRAAQEVVGGKWRLVFVPVKEQEGASLRGTPPCVQRFRVGRVQHSDLVSFITPMKKGPPLRLPAEAGVMKDQDKIQLTRVLLNQNPRIQIVLVGSRFWAS